ncbi:MAG: hypothetical protein AUG46_12210 [Acidobacteria bacterium 13_1_20CM_3_58_11]|nr:MAG: hypothetical protein AUG46_12210 [Acidobacteria bacterium 13_1_20CM_3_58_11]
MPVLNCFSEKLKSLYFLVVGLPVLSPFVFLRFSSTPVQKLAFGGAGHSKTPNRRQVLNQL